MEIAVSARFQPTLHGDSTPLIEGILRVGGQLYTLYMLSCALVGCDTGQECGEAVDSGRGR